MTVKLTTAAEAEVDAALRTARVSRRMHFERFLLAQKGRLSCASLDVEPGSCVVVQGTLVVKGSLFVAGESALFVLGDVRCADAHLGDAEVVITGTLDARRFAWLSGESDALFSFGGLRTPVLVASTLQGSRVAAGAKRWLRTDEPAMEAVARRLAGRRVFRSVGAHLAQALRDGVDVKSLR